MAVVGQAIDLATKAKLQHWRDVYFDCLLACTGFVGLGLLMEVLEIKHDVLEAIGRKSREHEYWLALPIYRKEYPEASARAKVLSAVGWILIVLGVMGEGVFEGFVSKYDTALSKMTDTIVAEAQKESAHAEATAKGFDAQIAESDAKAKSAEATAKQFEAQIAEARRAAAESNEVAENERMARIELEDAVAWRKLSKVNKNILTQSMLPFAGVYAALPCPDSEGCSFAADIALSLRAAKLQVYSPGFMMVWNTPSLNGPIKNQPNGVDISTTEDSAAIAAGKVVYDKLQSFGFDATPPRIDAPPDQKSRASQIWVSVYSRPEGPQGEAKLRAAARKK